MLHPFQEQIPQIPDASQVSSASNTINVLVLQRFSNSVCIKIIGELVINVDSHSDPLFSTKNLKHTSFSEQHFKKDSMWRCKSYQLRGSHLTSFSIISVIPKAWKRHIGEENVIQVIEQGRPTTC